MSAFSPFSILVMRSESFKALPELTGRGARSMRQAVKKTVESVAEQAKKLMKKVISTNTLVPQHGHSPMTFKILQARMALASKYRYSGAMPQSPLYRNRQIHDSIKRLALSGGDQFVGLTRSAKLKAAYDRRGSGRSRSLAQIARIQEQGATIRVGALSTAKRRRLINFFIALTIAGRKKGISISPPGDNTVFRIPPRSFRKPVEAAFNQRGFGEGQVFEKQAERAFLNTLMAGSPFLRRFMKVSA